jgi:hypothetical protein
MKQEYINCENGLTEQCPQVGNPLMQNFLTKTSHAKHVDHLTTAEELVNLLCNECDSFVPVEG